MRQTPHCQRKSNPKKQGFPRMLYDEEKKERLGTESKKLQRMQIWRQNSNSARETEKQTLEIHS
jgi:hypothetical protein